MLFMDLTINNQIVFQGQPALGQVLLMHKNYLGFTGGLMFVDTQGFDDPSWDGLNARYLLIYLSDGPAAQIPLQATPIQNLTVNLGGQICVIGLYEQPFPSSVPAYSALPVGFDEGYTNQAFLAPIRVVYADAWALGYYQVFP